MPRPYQDGATLKERKSPLGYTEWVVPRGMEAQYLAPGSHATVYGNVAYYSEPEANKPAITTHERIHVGQNQLERNPSKEQLSEILPDWAMELGKSSGVPSHEPPAYLFSSEMPASMPKSRREQQKNFNDYTDLIYRLNPDSAYNVEAAMPDSLIREYVTNHPRPAPPIPKPEMKERGIIDAILGR